MTSAALAAILIGLGLMLASESSLPSTSEPAPNPEPDPSPAGDPDQNQAAFLAMIRRAETGTDGPDAYRMFFGGTYFDTFEGHPNVIHTANGIRSTAAGAYQIRYATWTDIRRALGPIDFSPESQDAAAVWLIQRRGALEDVRAGRFDVAVGKLGQEWASLPSSQYGQHTWSFDDVLAWFKDAGGTQA